MRAAQKNGKSFSDTSVVKGLLCDPSQCLKRCTSAQGYDGIISTAMQNSIKYSFECDRLLVPADLLGVCGYPTSLLDEVSDGEARSIVGELLSAQQLALVMAGVAMVMKAPGLFVESSGTPGSQAGQPSSGPDHSWDTWSQLTELSESDTA